MHKKNATKEPSPSFVLACLSQNVCAQYRVEKSACL
uniref:Uncharacterized protein n=1 Tax=Romanomermis culicivorax TaxID=13658 RepID=A0A915HLJ0_ROMCU